MIFEICVYINSIFGYEKVIIFTKLFLFFLGEFVTTFYY